MIEELKRLHVENRALKDRISRMIQKHRDLQERYDRISEAYNRMAKPCKDTDVPDFLKDLLKERL